MFLGFGNIWSAGLHLQNKAKWFWVLSSLGALTNILLNIIFIPRYGLFAAALTTLISLSIQPIGYYFISKNSYNIKLPFNKILSMFFIYILVYFSSMILVNSIENLFLLIF